MHCQLENKHEVYIWLKSNQTCLVCDESSGTADPVCSACETELPWLMEHCEVCALPLPATGLVCGQCLKQPAAFKQVVAPWTYSFPIDSLISRFKHQARWPLGHLLAHLLGQFLQHRYEEAALARPECLLPVPLARKRLRERGFNQAAMLARWLNEDLNIPWDEHLLSRPRETVAQQDLDARTRKRNLHQAFALADDAQVKGRHLALIDDVLTTGATASSLARLLMDAGARQVDVYCLARTPKHGT